MEHADHVKLICGGVSDTGGTWAEFGSGSGAFTLALAELLGSDATIYSFDRDAHALREQTRLMRANFPAVTLHPFVADYRRPLPVTLPALDGVLLANALHFQASREQHDVAKGIRKLLKPEGRLLLVEYNTDRGNRWVPHPRSFATWQALARAHGFSDTRLLATRPSRFLGEIYAAVSLVGGE